MLVHLVSPWSVASGRHQKSFEERVLCGIPDVLEVLAR
jgi:hypothetical protein